MFFPTHALTPSHPTSPFSRWWQASPHLIDWSHPLCHTDHTPPKPPSPFPPIMIRPLTPPLAAPNAHRREISWKRKWTFFSLVLLGLGPFLGFFHRKIVIPLFIQISLKNSLIFAKLSPYNICPKFYAIFGNHSLKGSSTKKFSVA